MAERLLIALDAFTARGAGILLSPRITVKEPRRGPFAVTLHLPDGRHLPTTATLEVAHIRGPDGVFAMVRLPALTPSDVPAGTEVWIDDAEA